LTRSANSREKTPDNINTMRVFANVLAFMPLFVVVVAGRLHGHHGPQRLARRDVETSMITETITVFETVTVDPAPALIATTNVADVELAWPGAASQQRTNPLQFSVTTAISSSTSTSIALDVVLTWCGAITTENWFMTGLFFDCTIRHSRHLARVDPDR
jgi:hypothetical protein